MAWQMKRCQMVKSAYCPLSTWSRSKKGGIHQIKDPLLIGRWKRQKKVGQKANGKDFFFKKSFLLYRLFSLITLLKHGLDCTFNQLIGLKWLTHWNQTKQENLRVCAYSNKIHGFFSLRNPFDYLPSLVYANCKVVLANWSNWLLCLLKVF